MDACLDACNCTLKFIDILKRENRKRGIRRNDKLKLSRLFLRFCPHNNQEKKLSNFNGLIARLLILTNK
jgi:hypothetical protein